MTSGRDAAWSGESSEHEGSEERPGLQGWHELLTESIPHARVLSFGYDASSMTELSHLLDPGPIEQHAEELLASLRMAFQDQSKPANESITAGSDAGNVNKESRVPLIVVAHGYGGLIYERARCSD